jgi:cell division protein FtsI/penicillin-binding protein 2
MRVRGLYLIALLGLAFTTVSCDNHTPGPDDILKQFLAAWGKQDYQAMYELLSEDAKKQISVTDFASRYQQIYQGIDAQGMELTPKIPNDFKASGDKSTVLAFSAKWTTAITDPFTENYKVKLIRDDAGWRIDWSPELIFPQLKPGWKVRAESLDPARGSILTADGTALATNEDGYTIGLVPEKMKSESAKELSRVLHVPTDRVQDALNQSWVKPDLFVPVETVSQSQEKSMESALLKIPGVKITPSQNPVRVYPLGKSAAHVTGYIGAITAEQLDDKHKQEGYQATDNIGQQGLERVLEPQLRGKPGGKIWITDDKGVPQAILAERQPTPGDTVTLTINTTLQKALDQALGSRVGSAIVLDPETGAVLAMVSHPTFDPNRLMQGLTSGEWNHLLNSKDSPLINRALSAVPPGSTLKPLVAALALSDHVIQPRTTFPGTDHLQWQKDSSWGSYYVTRVPHPSGTVDLKHALVWSDNIYFAEVGLALGEARFTNGLERFGFGKTFPFPLTVGKSQVSDDGTIHSEIQLADSSYGQGQVLVSPLQLASMYTAFWNEGDVLQPYLIKRVSGAQAVEAQAGKRTVLAHQVISPDAIAQMQQDMRQVVADPTGTGHEVSDVTRWTVSGKTGTAQTAVGEWGWFSAVAMPRGQTQPKYLITMALANTQSEGGSHEAVRCAKSFLELVQP